VSDLRLLVDDDGDFSNGGTACYSNGDGSGILISYSNPIISISGLSASVINNNSLSYITIASTEEVTPLPIELESFETTCEGPEVTLSWTTISESNNDYFTIERSRDGKTFKSLATIDGNGSTQSINNYHWRDPYPLHGVKYYRLSQTDIDGANTIISTKAINCELNSDIQVYPNPANTAFIISSPYHGQLSIVNLTGKIVLQNKLNEGLSQIDVSHLSQGAYFVRIETMNGESQTVQLLKK
jgi:hypothetical protein